MKQKNEQVLGLKQTQKLSPQQVLEVRLLELSTEELLQRIETEMLENEALEKGAEEDGAASEELETEADPEGLDVTEDVLGDPEDDGMDTPSGAVMDPTGWQIRNEKTCHDLLMEQVGELNLEEGQIPIMQYLIGSLEEDGLLHKDLQRIADELYFNAGMQIPMEELETCLHLLQQFDPAGIGGRNLQECLLLQVKRLPQGSIKLLLLRILNEQFDNLLSNRWDRIAEHLELDKEMTERLRKEVKRLNPRPGRSLYADDGGSNTLMPDFLLTVEENDVQITLNNAIVPSLHVSQSYKEAIESVGKQTTKESAEFADIRKKIEKAQNFIQAIRQRRATLLNTMQAIINRQKDYFLTGDESLLRPLTMKEVAKEVKVDISTISRVCNNKYVSTPYGTQPLKRYFVERFAPRGEKSGNEVSAQQVKDKLKSFVNEEDKNMPYSDAQLQELMEKAGYKIARRTVAKYREQLGIPTATMRKV